MRKKRVEDPDVQQEWIAQLMPFYLANGFRKFTMDDIAARLGVSKATLYKHFKGRPQILKAVIDAKMAQLDALRRYLADEQVPYTLRYQEAVKSASKEMAGISKQFLLDAREEYPELSGQINDMANLATSLLGQFYHQGVERGILRPDIDPAFLALADNIFITAIANARFMERHGWTIEAAVEQYFVIKHKGIFREDPAAEHL